MRKIIFVAIFEFLEFRKISSNKDKDEDDEDANKLFQRMMRFISKSNRGSIPKVMYIDGFD